MAITNPKDPRYVRNDSLWQLLKKGKARSNDQRAAAEWIEWAMQRVSIDAAQRRRDDQRAAAEWIEWAMQRVSIDAAQRRRDGDA